VVLTQQHAAVVASAFATVTAVHFAMTLGPSVADFMEGQRRPRCTRRLRDVRRVREVALEGLRWDVVHDVRYAGWVVVDGRVHVVSLHGRMTSVGRSTK